MYRQAAGLPQALLPLCVIIPLKMVDCVSQMSAFTGHSSLRQRKIWIEIPDSHPFATKAPNHAIVPVFSRSSDSISPREITFALSCLCPTPPEAEQQVSSPLSLHLEKADGQGIPRQPGSLCCSVTATFSRQSWDVLTGRMTLSVTSWSLR